VSGAGNQQERPAIEAIEIALGAFLSGFALGEASFMIVCRQRSGANRSFRLSAAFNVSQQDRLPLDLFRETLACGTMRIAGNGGWYWEVNRLSDQAERIVPFFERFPLVGAKAQDFELYRQAVCLLRQPKLSESDYRAVLALRERMNRGGKRKYRMAGILRDYTPTSPV
jgi:LAGLIDADG endonuclease